MAPLIQIIIDEIRKACKKEPVSCGFNPSDNAYEPLKLMQTVMAKTNEVCLRYLDNSMLCSLPPPSHSYNITSVCAAKNRRRRMEDRHVVINDLNIMFNKQEASPSSYYAIFDGHAGHDAAAYSAAHLHQFLAECEYFQSNPQQAILYAFYRTDALFVEKCRVENFSSGTTAVCALLRPKEKLLYIAWVGDSQALLVKQGRVWQCVQPHKPSRQDERERIENQGGFVIYFGTWRVNGQLAVSRAIGDSAYKPYVTAVPDIREIQLDGDEDFLILACDGLWDHLSEDDAAKTVYDMVCENPDNTDLISERLVQLSKEEGSGDNISVIVVFLREPSKISADGHWRPNRCLLNNRSTIIQKMDTSLDNNINNPFVNSNGDSTTDNNTITQKSDGLLLNLSENFKQNAQDIVGASDYYHNNEKSNGKRLASELFDDNDNDDNDDLGPETNVDDDILSPSLVSAKQLAHDLINQNPHGSFNPFMEKDEVEKAAIELEFDLEEKRQLQDNKEFDFEKTANREETPTPPVDTVHDGGLVIDNIADSGEESEDEWNYFKGGEANKENISPIELQPDAEVAQITEESDNMSQLNPNAAEFVPISPTRSNPSPICRALINDPVIAQSPKRPPNNTNGDDEDIINLPSNPEEFEIEVKSRPSDVVDVFSINNGHANENENDEKTAPPDLMENILNGKNIDEIQEFQPISPTKVPSDQQHEEFHFGPNAAPFTPIKLQDQSEAGLSTKAVYGGNDETITDTSFNESTNNIDNDDNVDFTTSLIRNNKESNPMSMSFYQTDDDKTNIFTDLNKVQVIPDNLDEFLNKSDDNGEMEKNVQQFNNDNHNEFTTLNNDERIVQTTDLDKIVDVNDDNEKELASPNSNDEELINEPLKNIETASSLINIEEDSNKIQQLPDICNIAEQLKSEIEEFESVNEPKMEICHLSKSPVPESLENNKIEIQQNDLVNKQHNEALEVCDLLKEQQTDELKDCSNELEVCDLNEMRNNIEETCNLTNKPQMEFEEEFCDLSKTHDFKDMIENIDEEIKDISKDVSVEDITSSIKDQTSPPQITSPLPTMELFNVAENAEIITTTIESNEKSHENLSPILNESDIVKIPDLIASPKFQQDNNRESIATVDVNEFLNRSNISDVTSPLSPNYEQFQQDLNVSNIATEQVKIDIQPISSTLTTTTVTESKDVGKIENVAAITTVAAVSAVAAVAVAKPKTTTTKKPTTKSPTKPLSSSPSKPTKTIPATKSRLSVTASKPPVASKATKSNTATKPRTPISGSVTKCAAEKKPLTTTTIPAANGDIKSGTNLIGRKIDLSTKTTTTLKPKISPLTTNKLTRPTTAPVKTTTTKSSVVNGAIPKTKTGTISKTSSNIVGTKTTTTSSRLSNLKTSSASTKAVAQTSTTTTTMSKLRPTTAPQLKPRVPSSTITNRNLMNTNNSKTDSEKQIKDAANKLTASTKTTTMKTLVNGNRNVAKKTETLKPSATRTTKPKTTASAPITSTVKSTAIGKKTPTTTTVTKTKTTKIEKPQQNGISTVVTEQITIVNNTEQQLIKDNSPIIDNKLIIDNNAITTNNSD